MSTLQERLRANPLPLPNVMELCREAADRIDALEAENAALRVDAERYRWLREHAHWEDERDMAPGGRWWAAVIVSKGKPTFDAAIDAAIAKSKT